MNSSPLWELRVMSFTLLNFKTLLSSPLSPLIPLFPLIIEILSVTLTQHWKAFQHLSISQVLTSITVYGTVSHSQAELDQSLRRGSQKIFCHRR